MDLSAFEQKVYSQNGEDGITMKLLELIYDEGYDKNKFYVEFGVQNGDECNTRILREKYNWNGLQMDGGYENRFVKKEFITKENIIELFKKYHVPDKINLLSVDIDFNDFYCLHEILKKYTCDIIICEYNATHSPDEDKVIVYDAYERWDCSNYFGASLLSYKKLANLFNYSLVYCDNKGVNCFFINNEIIKNKKLNFINDIHDIYKLPKYGSGPNGGHGQDSRSRSYISFEEAIVSIVC